MSNDCLTCLGGESFAIAYVTGDARFGKTHFAIFLADSLSEKGFFPRLLDGSSFAAWTDEKLLSGKCSPDEVVIIDDANDYFSQLTEERSGQFVALVEAFRVNNSKLCFFSCQQLDQISSDQHVTSRLKPALGFHMQNPAAEEIKELLAVMARQRGIALSERQISYLEKRVPRDIPALELFLQNVDYLSQVLGQPIKTSLLADAL